MCKETNKHLGHEQTNSPRWKNHFQAVMCHFMFRFSSASTCLTSRVLSLHGVVPALFSPSSCTIMVFTDSVSPLLSLEELWKRRNRKINSTHQLNQRRSKPTVLKSVKDEPGSFFYP